MNLKKSKQQQSLKATLTLSMVKKKIYRPRFTVYVVFSKKEPRKLWY